MKILKTTFILVLTLFTFQQAKAQYVDPTPPGHPWNGSYLDGTTFVITNNTDCYFHVSFSQSCGGCANFSTGVWYDFPPFTTAYDVNLIKDGNNVTLYNPGNEIKMICVRNYATMAQTSWCLGGATEATNILVGSCFNPATNQIEDVFMDYDTDGIFSGFAYPIAVTLHY